ncbi:MAG: alpha-amylase family protein [Pseudobacteriovorax sp.]|nr:alpha-amylase family protein [Pseudobacteriovorax sp.]
MRNFSRILYLMFLFQGKSLFAGSEGLPRTVFVHLFEWSWNDIEKECPLLGELGYGAVQVSPPQESIDRPEWWSRYQPVSYQIQGRSGFEEDFRRMIRVCGEHGVEIYADAVINHMAARNRNFPGVPYSSLDFHTCFVPIDYSDRFKIQNCDLNGLNDLATEKEYVRSMIANYLNKLIDMGVRGLRIDAAKHIPADDIANIISRLRGNPYIFQEVIGAAQEPVTVFEYDQIADVTEFLYGTTLGRHFKGQAALKELRYLNFFDGWLNSDNAVVFTDNHDTQRYEPFSVMTFKDDGRRYNLANVFMLSYPYGYPKVMSSYRFNSFDQGPPSQRVYQGAGCFNEWVCEHRWTSIANMVEFRNVTAKDFRIDNWWDNGFNQIAFSRGSSGFVAINGENFRMQQRLFTGMAPGRYCNVTSGRLIASENRCEGGDITVDQNGFVIIDIEAFGSLAIHERSRYSF